MLRRVATRVVDGWFVGAERGLTPRKRCVSGIGLKDESKVKRPPAFTPRNFATSRGDGSVADRPTRRIMHCDVSTCD